MKKQLPKQRAILSPQGNEKKWNNPNNSDDKEHRTAIGKQSGSPGKKKGTRKKEHKQCTLSETIAFLGKRLAQAPQENSAKIRRMDPKKRFSVLSDIQEEEDEGEPDDIKWLTKAKVDHNSSIQKALMILLQDKIIAQEKEQEEQEKER